MTNKVSNADRRPRLTAEELRLIRTPDAEVRAAAKAASFEYDRMVERVSGDSWQAIIQAHLYIDHTISALIAEAVPNPKALQLDRLGLSQKLDLVSSLRLLPDWLIALLRSVNRLRNLISHQLDFEVTEDQTAEIFKRLPRKFEAHIKADPEPYPGYDLRKVLIYINLFTDVMRNNLSADRAVGKKAALQLRKAAQDLRADEPLDLGLLK